MTKNEGVDYGEKVKDILDNAKTYHDKFKEDKRFTGPSLHFHRRAISRKDWLSESHIEMVYAVLVSWGMHRMGEGGAKMVDFETFKNRIETVSEELKALRDLEPKHMKIDSNWSKLKNVFRGIEVMKSTTKIVGNSKVMAHLLPNIVAPIDRQYTLQFLFDSKHIKNDKEAEWILMKDIHELFFYPIVKNPRFLRCVEKENWLSNDSDYHWDTSKLKVIDNLIIGSITIKKEKETEDKKTKKEKQKKPLSGRKKAS